MGSGVEPFRQKRSIGYSGVSWPLIPIEVVHRFRRMLSRDSDVKLSTFYKVLE
jgi:hypothetical protein